jgi:hypothetical protein
MLLIAIAIATAAAAATALVCGILDIAIAQPNWHFLNIEL